METKVFPKPAVAGELKKFIEVRLHVDDQTDPERAARYQKLQVELATTKALPTYLIVDPSHPEKPLSVFDSAQLKDTEAFRTWLRQNAG